MPVYFAIVALLLGGCTLPVSFSQHEPSPKVYTTPPASAVSEPKKSAPATPASGFIKGEIVKLGFNATTASWEYEVKGVDTTNNTLPYARFTHPSRQFKVGDIVYAKVEKGRLQEMYGISTLGIKAVSPPTQQKPDAVSPSLGKRTKERQLISVPQSERIIIE
jgi:hypothetical protein